MTSMKSISDVSTAKIYLAYASIGYSPSIMKWNLRKLYKCKLLFFNELWKFSDSTICCLSSDLFLHLNEINNTLGLQFCKNVTTILNNLVNNNQLLLLYKLKAALIQDMFVRQFGQFICWITWWPPWIKLKLPFVNYFQISYIIYNWPVHLNNVFVL